MSWKKKVTGVGVAIALAATFALGSGLPAAATTEAPNEPSVVAVEPTPEVLLDETTPTEDPAIDTESTRVVPIVAIITAVVFAGGTAWGMGAESAKRLYYAGLRNAEYQDNKWLVRATAVGLVGAVLGISFMVGFENQFYSMS